MLSDLRSAALLLLTACSAAWAGTPDDLLLSANRAWQLHDRAKLDQAAHALGNDSLADYVAYWRLDLKLSEPGPPPSEEVRAFLARFPDSPLAEPLKTSWLKALGRVQDWETFAAQVTPASLEDPEVACDQLQERLYRQDLAVMHDARQLWLSRKGPNPGCDPVFRLLTAEGVITRNDLWTALRQALGSNNLVQARYVNSFLSPFQGLGEDDLTQAYTHPGQYLEQWDTRDITPAARELALFAISQLASRHPQEAADTWTRLAPAFNRRDQSWGWLQIAWQSVLLHHPGALDWFHQAGEPLPDDSLRAWRTRAALLRQNWEEVLQSINGMSAADAGKPAWRYWKGRALQALGHPTEAQALWAPLARETHYYGLLALEEMGGQFSLPAPAMPPTPEEMETTQPRLQRALRLHELGLTPESQFEWGAVNRSLTNRQKLAASHVAFREHWFDRAIYSMERAGDQQEPDLRYPLAFQEEVMLSARQNQLDPAWVFGLVRQESYFFPEARSRTGAMGLMQLMPATARWVARRIPLKKFRWARATHVDTNLQLGTFYLHHLLDQLGDPILATAGYNAGPNRVLRWVSGQPQEAAIFIEAIPLNETRSYVQNVMFNSVVYARRLNLPQVSLHQRIGTLRGVTPARSSEPDPANQP